MAYGYVLTVRDRKWILKGHVVVGVQIEIYELYVPTRSWVTAENTTRSVDVSVSGCGFGPKIIQ